MSKNTDTISAAAERITAIDETDPLAHLVNIGAIATEADAEAAAVTIAVANDAATTRHTERTIRAKTSIGLAIWRAAQIRVAADESGKLAMPDVKIATIGKLAKILGLSDDPGKSADGAALRDASERFGYAMGTLGACVDLARGVIADVDKLARQDLVDADVSVSERPLRSAILARINPDAVRNRAAGAETMAAAKLAVAAGRKAGTVKIGDKLVKIDAEAVTKVRNTITASALSDAAIAALSDDAIDATIRALQLVKSAREAGLAKAPKVAKASAAE